MGSRATASQTVGPFYRIGLEKLYVADLAPPAAKGDKISIYSPNTPEYASVFFGVLSVGGVCVMSNPLYTADELRAADGVTPSAISDHYLLLPTDLNPRIGVEAASITAGATTTYDQMLALQNHFRAFEYSVELSARSGDPIDQFLCDVETDQHHGQQRTGRQQRLGVDGQ